MRSTVAPIDLIAFALAIVICTAGVAALAGHFLNPDRSHRLLLWFGIFSEIYGVRMFFKQTLASALGIRPMTALWVEHALNYFILIPALLFIEELYGVGWKRSLRWGTIAAALYAVAAVAIDAAAGDARVVPDPSLWLLAFVAAVIIGGVVLGYRPPRFSDWRILIVGVGVFMLFVINDHAVGARAVPWRFTAEPVGFVVQLVCFGYIALSRVVARDRELAAVDHEMRSAREIQASLLPRDLPAVEHVTIAARYIPLAAVAGDFYDVVPLTGGAVAVFVADVSGHGVPAALIASMVKVSFAAAICDANDPAVILQRINASLCGLFERSYVTAACAILRPLSRTLSYALAGHPSPLLIGARDSGVVSLDERGLFLGVMPTASYETATVPIETGTRLILFTDGITETPARDGDLFGIERLTAFALDEWRRPPDSFADELIASLERFAGTASLPHDDVTLLVVDVR
ncbi:MAG TPA: PP2C family protein-serine/threonine phosphatase [Vicinamibacterales bacterium]